jgi:hypothetical protein
MTTAPEDQSEREAFEDAYFSSCPLSAETSEHMDFAWWGWSAALRAPKVERDDFAEEDMAILRLALIEFSKNMERGPDARNRAYMMWQVLRQERLEALSHPLPALAPLQVEAPQIEVAQMKESHRVTHWVRIKVGDREITPYYSESPGRVAYEAAMWRWLLLGAEKPDIAAVDESIPPQVDNKPQG